WRRRPGGGPLIEVLAAALTAGLTWAVWRSSTPTAALAIAILTLQSTKLLFPRREGPREAAPPLAQVLFPPGSEREASLVEAASVVLLGAAAAQSFRPSFAPLFLLGGVSLLLNRVGRARARAAVLARPSQARSEPRHAPWGAFVPTLAGAGALAALALFAVPRLGTRYLPQHLQTGERMSGFTDDVGLDDIGRLQQNTAPAFHVESADGQDLPAELYWRGAALDRYDGARWRHSEAGSLLARLGRDGPGVFETRRLWGRDTPGARRVVLYLEPLGTRMLFTTGAPRSLRFRGLSPDTVWRTELGTLYTKRAYAAALCYELEFYPDQVPQFLDNTPIQHLARRRCRELPPAVNTSRLRAYARQVLSDAGVTNDAGPDVVARTLEAHLASRFDYSLEGARTPGLEPVEDFLFVRRTGHCEVFASALVVLLRCLDIPARVVTGYRSRPEEGATTHTVRQSDAHAWVEAQVDGWRWRRFEPTPAASWDAVNQGLSALERVELLWFKWVVAYDAREQNALWQELVTRAAVGLQAAKRWLSRPAGALVAVLTLGLAGWLLLGRRRRRRARRGPFEPGEVLRPLLAALEREGSVRLAGETLADFGRRVGLDPVERAFGVYYASRFGPAGPEDLVRVREAVGAALEAVARRRQGGPG
ncbi:MAG: DUF3488 and transglutaminase-like domain-containing protein, partial [Planctomycetota bacterium]